MSDTTLTCRDCGQAFVFTAGEQAFYEERGFARPQRCPTCRAKRKAEHGAANSGDENGGGSTYASAGLATSPRQMYKAICSNCGKTTEVPFLPRSERPVYCGECFATRRPEAQRSYSNL